MLDSILLVLAIASCFFLVTLFKSLRVQAVAFLSLGVLMFVMLGKPVPYLGGGEIHGYYEKPEESIVMLVGDPARCVIVPWREADSSELYSATQESRLLQYRMEFAEGERVFAPPRIELEMKE